MVRIRNTHRILKNESLKSRVEFHFEKMNGVALYAPFQPLVTELGGLFAPFGTAITNSKLGGVDRTDAKNKIQTDIIAIVDDIVRQLGVAANAKNVSQAEGEALVKGGGFEVHEARAPKPKKVVTFLDAPKGLKATDEKKHGSVSLEWEEDDDAITYVILDQIAEGHWQIAGVSETSPVVLSGFPFKANRTFCILGISNGTVMSDRSEPVTVWIS